MKGSRCRWPCLALLGAILLVPTVCRPAEPSRKAYLFPPTELIQEGTEYSWLPAAVSEGLKMILQRLGLEVANDPRENHQLPAEYQRLTTQQARDWLGREQAPQVGYLVFSRIKLSGGEATVTFFVSDLVGERNVKEYRVGGLVNRLPALLLKQAEYLLDYTGAKVSAQARDDALRGFTDSLEALRALGAYAQAADNEGSEKALRAAVTADPLFVSAWMRLGLVQYALGRKAEASESFRKVVEISPGFKEAYNNLGVILSDDADAAPALKAFRDALKIDDGYQEARFNLGKLLDKVRQNEDALKEYDKLLASQPERNDVRFLMALVLDRLGRSEQALEEFRRLSPKDPSLAEEFFLKKGQEARKERKFPDAELFFKRALDINPKLTQVYRERGLNRYLAGEFEQAVNIFRTAAEREPESAEDQHYLGLAAVRAGRFDEAVSAFQRAVELGNLKESNLELGRLLVDQGRYAEAIGSLNRYLKDEPLSDEAKSLLAQATRKARDETELRQKQSDFAIHRLDRMEDVVKDLNRRNSELETRLAGAAETNARLEAENRSLRESKTALEQELSRRLQESAEGLRSLNQQLGGLQSTQEQRIVGLERDLNGERKARQEAEGSLQHLLRKLQEEGKVTITQGMTEAEAEEGRRRLETLGARVKELESALEARRREMESAARVQERLTADHQRELDEVTATRRDIAAELTGLRADYDRRLAESVTRQEQGKANGQGETLAGLQREVDEIRARLEQERKEGSVKLGDSQTRAAVLERERTALQSQVTGLNASLDRKGKELESATGDLARRRKENDALKGETTDLRRQLEELAGRLKSLQGELDELKARAAAGDEKNKSLQQANAETEQARLKTTEAEKKLKGALETAGSLSRDQEKLKKDLADLERSWQQKYQAQVDAGKTREAELARQREADLSHGREIETRLADEQKRRQEAEQKSREAGGASAEMKKAVQERDRLDRENAALYDARQQAEARATSAEQRLAATRTLDDRLKTAQADLAVARQKVTDREELQQQRDAAQERLSTMKRELDKLNEDSRKLRSASLDRFRELGDLYRRGGQRAKAEEAYQLILRYDPENGKAYLALGELYYEMADYERSKEMYAKAASLLREGDR